MEKELLLNIVNVLYYLYFEKRELIYHFERIWTEDDMKYYDEKYSYIFCGIGNPDFCVDLETLYFLCENGIIEETSGNQHESIYILNDYYKIFLTTILKEKYIERKTVT
jgi:hypothetical protein